MASLATLSIAQHLNKQTYNDKFKLESELNEICDYLNTSRPTAVNLRIALDRVRNSIINHDDNVQNLKENAINECILIWSEDVERNKKMADNGAKWLINHLESTNAIKKDEKFSILTVCNTGSLATSGYGTAFGLITRLHELDRLERAYYTQTTPYHQGTRLTAFEFIQLGIRSCMVCDTAVGSLISNKKVQAVAVGADRIAMNGDTANKIGTLQSALFANQFKLPFLVVAPRASVDQNLENGAKIPIELRSSSEACTVNGLTNDNQLTSVRVAPKEIGTSDLHQVYNPGFDVTPSTLISSVVSEVGVAVHVNNNENIDMKSIL